MTVSFLQSALAREQSVEQVPHRVLVVEDSIGHPRRLWLMSQGSGSLKRPTGWKHSVGYTN